MQVIKIISGARTQRKLALCVVLSSTLALTACASVNTVMSREADEVFHSPHSADEVAACFANRNHIRLMERADGARVARFNNGYGFVTRTYSIYPEGTGSRIEQRAGAMATPGARWKQCVGLKPWKAAG